MKRHFTALMLITVCVIVNVCNGLNPRIISLVELKMLLVACQLSRDVIGCED